MSADPIFRWLAHLEADEQGVTYDELVAGQVGTSLLEVVFHYDVKTAFRGYLANLRHARRQPTPDTSAPAPPW